MARRADRARDGRATSARSRRPEDRRRDRASPRSRRAWSRTSGATGSWWCPTCCPPTSWRASAPPSTRGSPGAAGTTPRTLAEKSRYEQSFTQCQNLWEDCPDVRPLTFHPLIAETAARLLGVDAVRLWHDQALYKEAGGRETDPHQDHPYWPIVETDTITAWIPFDGSTLETGAMGYLPGSHRLGVREFVDIFSGHGDDPLTRTELQAIAAGVRRGAGRVGRLPPRPHVPLGQAEPDRYRPPGAHRHLLRRRVDPGRGVASRIPRWSGPGSPWVPSSPATSRRWPGRAPTARCPTHPPSADRAVTDAGAHGGAARLVDGAGLLPHRRLRRPARRARRCWSG